MNVRYLKANTSGGITATAAVVKKGRRVITLQAEVTDDSSNVLAQAGASFMILGKKG
jgi:acyl-coenzyme A thioesterase PaaI-like protein